MSDPTIQKYCCHRINGNDSSPMYKMMDELNKESYLMVCLFSSALGIAGALYQIFVRVEPKTVERNGNNLRNIGRNIIVWLAIADLSASSGIFFRSSIWKTFASAPDQNDTPSVLFCTITSAWIQYFYICTWLWTFCYAIEVRRTLKRQKSNEKLYHFIVWTTAMLLTSVGLTCLYYPDADCNNTSYLSNSLHRVLPNYIVTYLPIALIMCVNPILYVSSCKEIDLQLKLTFNQVTTRERKVMSTFKWKFSLINIVFYLCWLPNIISGIIIWTCYHHPPETVTIGLWYLMAATNPLQAFFNALVYRKWNGSKPQIIRNPGRRISYLSNLDGTTERSPLLKLTSDSQNTTTTTTTTTTAIAADTANQLIESLRIDTDFSVNKCACN